MHHITEFNKNTLLKDKYKDNAYMLWVLGLYLDEPDLDALAGRSLTDGGNDKCLDFIEIDKTGQKIIIAQGYFSDKPADKAPSKKAADLTIAASWLVHGEDSAKTLSEKVKIRALECREALEAEEIEQIELLYIHNRPESINTQEEIETCEKTAQVLFDCYEVPVSCKELGLTQIESIYRERSSQILIKDQIKIDGSHQGSHSTPDWDAYIYTVKGSWLRDLFKTYDERLFSANYRGFLGISKRKKINSAIKSTAERQPSDFWVFNNGVTLLTNGISKTNQEYFLSGASIINGAQTTGSLGSTGATSDLQNVQVMCRVVICKNPAKIEEIVKYNNTQNKITTWDQYANDEVQALLKRQFDALGIEYSMKRGFDSLESTIGIEKSAQPVLAFNGHYADANRGKNSIFERPEIYKKAFHEKSAAHILLAYCFARSIDEIKLSLENKQTKTDNETKQLFYFNYFSFRYFLLACIGASLQQFIGKSFSPNSAKINKDHISNDIPKIVESLGKITRQVLRATARALEEKYKASQIPMAKILRDELTLNEIKSDLSSFIESVLDGAIDPAHQALIYVEN